MSTNDVVIYVIGPTHSIDPGEAKAFSLMRVGEDGVAKPFPIVVVRKNATEFFGFVNRCPHQGLWLNIGCGTFFGEDRKRLRCGRHGAEFEMETGMCIKGPCQSASLEPIPIAIIGADICLCGITLVEEDEEANAQSLVDEPDESMEIMISPD